MLAIAGCAGTRTIIVHGPRTAPPSVASATTARRAPDSSKAREVVQQSVLDPIRSLVYSPGVARKLAGLHPEAYNVTSTDDVEEDSNWLVTRGSQPDPESPVTPDTTGPWIVTAVRLRGDRPVITIHDAHGDEFWLTFDSPDQDEIATAAEVITAQLYGRAGYHVPTVALVTFDAKRQLQFSDTAAARATLSRLPRRDDGLVRSASHHVPGQPLGQFSFSGQRSDDPADTIAHEHRRELRGLSVVAAWLNHVGLFRGTTLDVAVDSAGLVRIKHYLTGFESSLSIEGHRPGTEAHWDAGRVLTRLLTLGFYAAPWERSVTAPFDAGRWTPNYANAAFARRTVRDGFWGAKLVAGISEESVRAAVAAGALTDSTVAAALVHLLLSRRAITMRYWFARVTPLTELAIEHTDEGASLRFRDLAVSLGLTSGPTRAYETRIWTPAADVARFVRVATISSDGRGRLRLPLAAAGERWQDRSLEQRLGWIDVRAVTEGSPRPRAVRIYVIPDSATTYRVVGWRY